MSDARQRHAQESFIARGFVPGLVHWTAPASLTEAEVLAAVGEDLTIKSNLAIAGKGARVSFVLRVEYVTPLATDELTVIGKVIKFGIFDQLPGYDPQLLETLPKPIDVRIVMAVFRLGDTCLPEEIGQVCVLWLQTIPAQEAPGAPGLIVASGPFVLP